MIKLLHTADWHLGLRFPALAEADALQLTRARLEVVGRILELAEQEAVDAVLCAGDLFDEPLPHKDWWEGLAELLQRPGWPASRLLIMLPGNHDPLLEESVWSPEHQLRSLLPEWVRVVDRPGFSCELGPQAVLLATPCQSRAGDRDPTQLLPAREPGDQRLRIGLVHGQTFDMAGYQGSFPIARDAAARLGLDYLALGDTHSFREVPGSVATVYPGTPEPTKAGEPEAGHVALVTLPGRGRPPRIVKHRVGHWTWRREHCRDLGSLRRLVAEEGLERCVLRLDLELVVSLAEHAEVMDILDQLAGTPARPGSAGILQLLRRRIILRPAAESDFPEELPPLLAEVVARLEQLRDGHESTAAERALCHLYQLVHQAQG